MQLSHLRIVIDDQIQIDTMSSHGHKRIFIP